MVLMGFHQRKWFFFYFCSFLGGGVLSWIWSGFLSWFGFWGFFLLRLAFSEAVTAVCKIH